MKLISSCHLRLSEKEQSKLVLKCAHQIKVREVLPVIEGAVNAQCELG